MSYTACIQSMDSYLIVTVSGSIESSEELADLAGLLVSMGREYGMTRALLKEYRLIKNVDALDIYSVGEAQVSVEAAAMGVRVACLPNPDEIQLAHTLETVLCNRSVNYRIFEDEETAVAWLTS
ncbi:hypothetical protein [Pseudodesulfovibrio indicus]|uniref:hypothetical protein n=1 Tax=Pseudodesulfovibrio indicus TaxID=1716143 RepID=UPI00292D1CA0|nr:hypothetical protein [Pseudodesulfovibrio indicus]